jgi:gamma-tubulin complex component 5
MDAGGTQWMDFHSLNTAFHDIISSSSVSSIKPSLVRFFFRPPANLASSSHRSTVKILEGFLLDYTLPFPLTYIFTPESMYKVYGKVFVFLMQIRRAKLCLDVKEDIKTWLDRGEEKAFFYALKARLGWFVKYVPLLLLNSSLN